MSLHSGKRVGGFDFIPARSLLCEPDPAGNTSAELLKCPDREDSSVLRLFLVVRILPVRNPAAIDDHGIEFVGCPSQPSLLRQ